MIDVASAFIRAQIASVETRISYASEVLDWAHGQQTLVPADLVPLPSDPKERHIAERDFHRLRKQAQSKGPRTLKTRRAGAVGDINWGGDNEGGIDKRLEALDLRGLARKAFDPLFANGITAAWAFKDEATGRSRLQLLGGYLEPFYYDDDPDGEVIGLYQVTQDPEQDKIRYRVRIYDLTARTIREWRDLEKPTDLAGTPHEWADTSVPRIVIYDTDQAGLPVGELAQELPEVIGELVQQLRTLRVADGHAWPILYQAGPWERFDELGANTIMISHDSDAKAGRIEPGDMDQLFTLQDRVQERLQGNLNLPIMTMGGNTPPSGEAIMQTNIGYIMTSRDYAHLLTRLFTEAVGDYAELEGIADPPPVIVSVSREQQRATASMQIREDYKAGVISLRMAVMELAPYYPASSSADIEEHILREESPLAIDEELPATPVPGEE